MPMHVFLLVVSTLLIALLPRSAQAQDNDPCLEQLQGDTERLEEYDTYVGRYLEALDTSNPTGQLSALDHLQGICDANLRLSVFRGHALRDLDRCGDAVEQYQWVLSVAETWPDPEHAKDAYQRAEEGLDTLLDLCLARVRISCKTPDSTVQVGQRPSQSCEEPLYVTAGSHTLHVSASGHHPRSETVEFLAGNNTIIFDALAPIESAGNVDFQCEDARVEILVAQERFWCPTVWSFPAGTITYRALRPNADPLDGTVTVLQNQTVTVTIPTAGSATITGPDTPPDDEDSLEIRLRVLGGGGQSFASETFGESEAESAFFGSAEIGIPYVFTGANTGSMEIDVMLRVGYLESGIGVLGMLLFHYGIDIEALSLYGRFGAGYGSIGIPKPLANVDASESLGFVLAAGVLVRYEITDIIGVAITLGALFNTELFTAFDIGAGIELRF